MRGDSEDARFDLLEQSGDVLVVKWKLEEIKRHVILLNSLSLPKIHSPQRESLI